MLPWKGPVLTGLAEGLGDGPAVTHSNEVLDGGRDGARQGGG